MIKREYKEWIDADTGEVIPVEQITKRCGEKNFWKIVRSKFRLKQIKKHTKEEQPSAPEIVVEEKPKKKRTKKQQVENENETSENTEKEPQTTEKTEEPAKTPEKKTTAKSREKVMTKNTKNKKE